MAQSPAIDPVHIEQAVHGAGLAGRAVCLHSSLRSFGVVAGGADAVLDAFLAADVTLLVPTASARAFAAPAPPGHRPLPFNCENDGSIPLAGNVCAGTRNVPRGFSVTTDVVDREMGAIPAAVLRRPARRRGDHPLFSFTALGPAADELVAGQTPQDVFAPLRALASGGGAVLLAGVDLTSATILHLAEEQAGLRLLVRWATVDDGATVAARHGGCSRGFERLRGRLAAGERRVTVGAGRWRVFDAAWILSRATEVFRADPAAGLCRHPDCRRCADQRAYVEKSRLG